MKHRSVDTAWLTAGPSNRRMAAGVGGRTVDELSARPTANSTSGKKNNP